MAEAVTISEQAAADRSLGTKFRDLVALTKPRVSLMVLITAAGGMWIAPLSVSATKMAATLLGMVLIVGSANALNCWLERDLDRLMARTKNRPLPDERLSARTGFLFGVLLALLGLPILFFGVNTLTGWLGVGAIVSYVAIYTPMKTLTPTAVLAGAVPGALPPLMGWTAAMNEVSGPALSLFGVLFAWQIPHVIAISSFRRDEYAAAGMRVLPLVAGDKLSAVHATVWAASLLPISFSLVFFGVAGWGYAVISLLLGLVYAGVCLPALWREMDGRWARRVFVVSLFYLPIFFAALLLDAR